MKTMKYLPILGLLVMLASCKQKEPKQQEHAAKTVVDSALVAEKTPLAKPLRLENPANEILLNPYWKLQAALVESNAFGARKAALLLEEAARQVKDKQVIAQKAAAILQESDLEKQRVHFSTISQELIKLVEMDGVREGAVHVAFCPMAMEDKGAFWLSPENEVINPYFGASMLTCGSIEKTIE
ncbi:MAG: DUF3347 domain-containing protein [Flavipsychrobacter sp.]|jgi:hypothetical protein|nr:DUF3347 domain-containing protein [Flavipsychrobacter sp.]